jgi:predicted negative regulator of RcsB-dependent stress response
MKDFVKTHRTLLISIIIALVLLAVWAWFAGNARQQTSFRRTDDRAKQVKTLTKDAYKGDRKDRLTAINSIAHLQQSGTCHGDWWNDWQQSVLPTIKNAAERCRTKERSIVKAIQAANGLQRYTADEQKISKQIGTLSVDVAAKDWPTKAKTAAQTAVKALDGIRIGSSAQPVQKAAKARIEVIISGWNSLNTASSKQDKTAYLAAETQLKQAYADLAAISDVSDTQVLKQFGGLSAAASTL